MTEHSLTRKKIIFSQMFLQLVMISCTKTESKITLPNAEMTQAADVASTQDVAKGSEQSTTSIVPEDDKSATSQVSRVSGTITAAKQGQASFRLPGQIVQTFVNVGDKVKKGQLIAQQVETDYQLRKKMSLVQISQAQLNLEQAKRDSARESQLLREGATTPVNIERISNQLASAQLNLNIAQLNLEQIEDQLNDTKLLAPFSGVISRRHRVEGEWVGAGAQVFDISALDEIEVNLKVPAGLLSKIRIKQNIDLFIPGMDKKLDMIVSRIVPVIQENSRTFEVIGKVSKSEVQLIPGQFVEAQF